MSKDPAYAQNTERGCKPARPKSENLSYSKSKGEALIGTNDAMLMIKTLPRRAKALSLTMRPC